MTFIAIFEGMWMKTKNPHYLAICKFWTKILALTFGMGIVSGIVMEFQLGTNWSHFTHAVGSVLGALFTYEVLTAFFIEAGFLGVMFFGWNRVSPGLHFASTLLVLAGVTVSTFWIMSANSWMQTPAGAKIVDGVFQVENWWDVIFNPSFLSRYVHMMLATYVASFFVIAGVSAYYLLRKKHISFARTCFSFVMWALLILMPLQIYMGDRVGLVIHEHQPIKTAAMEGMWETQKGAPLILFAWPDQKAEKNYFAIKIPKLASWLNTHDLDGELVGLKSVSEANRPYVPFVFWSFRIMVGLGILMLFVAMAALVLRFKNRLYNHKLFLKLCILTAPAGFITIIFGWFTAEFGRQPWVVYGLLRTAQAHSPISLNSVFISLVSIIVVYGIIFGYFYFHYFFRIISAGPDHKDPKLLDQAFYYLSPDIRNAETKNTRP